MSIFNPLEEQRRNDIRLAELSREVSNIKLVLGTALVYLQKELGTKAVEDLLEQLQPTGKAAEREETP